MTHLLIHLKKSEAPLSGTVLAKRLGVTRSAVHKQIQKLRAQGQRISGTHRVGYLWRGGDEGVDPEALKVGRVTSVIHQRVLGSTQDEAKARAARGAPEGTLVLADRQTAGRGRRGREWASPTGGLWFSLVLRPPLGPDRVPALALVAALSWVNVLRGRSVPALVKWPNDVWVGGRKIAGILTEMSAESDRVHWVVLGVGVNVNNPPPSTSGVPATSVSRWIGPTSRLSLLADGLRDFSRAYDRYLRSGFSPFRKAFEGCSVLKGQEVSFEGDDGSGRGRVVGVDAEGRLRLETASGTKTCWGGDVSLLRPRDLSRERRDPSQKSRR